MLRRYIALALAVLALLICFDAAPVAGAPLRQSTGNHVVVSAQTTLSLNVKLADGSTVVVPLRLETATDIHDAGGSMAVKATVGEGASVTTVTVGAIPIDIKLITPDAIHIIFTGGATANRDANLRQGAGTDFAIIGHVREGEALDIVGCNSDCTWLQLANGAWIAAFLVDDAPSDLIVVSQPVKQGGVATPVAATRACDPNYTGACVPMVGYDLNCPDVGVKDFKSVGYDPHGFDDDKDGIACES